MGGLGWWPLMGGLWCGASEGSLWLGEEGGGSNESPLVGGFGEGSGGIRSLKSVSIPGSRTCSEANIMRGIEFF